MSDAYRPREHDHLIEPFFGGLGAGEGDGDPAQPREEEAPSEELRGSAPRRGRRVFWAAVLIALGWLAFLVFGR